MIPDAVAKATAVFVALLLAASVGILVVTSNPRPGAMQVPVEFEDAFPLIEGMHVRVDGAIAGSVGEIAVNDRGNARVTLVLNDSIEAPMADATAAIRQQDTTGDSYVAFDPGGDTGSEPLGEDGITCESASRCSRTLVAPRLDDLLNAFGPSERSGIQLILSELAIGLDRRGVDLNGAALRLKPAIESANQALGEVREHNAALKQLVSSAERVTGQAAAKNRRLARLVESLAATTNTTAANAGALDAGLEKLPQTTAQARTTLAKLGDAAEAGIPLADRLAEGAPDLANALVLTPGFLDNAEGFLGDTRSTLDLTRKLLRTAEPTLRIGKKRVVTGAFDLVGATADLLNAVLGGEDAFPALFDDDSYGDPDAGTLSRRGFGAVAVEPGNLPGYSDSQIDRNWLRVSAVMNCEVFGRPVEPGCLVDYLTSGSPTRAVATRRGQRGSRPNSASPLTRPSAGSRERKGAAPKAPPRSGLGGLRPTPNGAAGRSPGRAADDLLDYLLGNG